jgi:sialate O-acetylesterase
MAIKLAPFFNDNMVIQADVPIIIKGSAKPGENISASLCGKKGSARADKNGEFSITIPALPAGGPYILKVNNLTFNNILIGDIWLCSGQSNMEWPVNQSIGGESALKTTIDKKLRLFSIPHRMANLPLSDLPKECIWKEIDKESLNQFSAVGFFFGEELRKKTGRPIGLVNASWGGTRVEPWTSIEGMERWTKFKDKYGHIQDLFSKKKRPVISNQTSAQNETVHIDDGNRGTYSGLHAVSTDTSKWKKMTLPGYWTDQKIDCVGAFWLRKEVDIPKSWLGNDLYISLGAFVDFDITYVNGESVGFTGKETPSFWSVPRKYVIPARLVRQGKNFIAVRVFAHKFVGGSNAATSDLNVSVINKSELGRKNLAGEWKYFIERKLPRIGGPVSVGNNKSTFLESTTPTYIYNAMIAPIVTMAIKGAIWYQGESNASAPEEYADLFSNMISDWRSKWGHEFPFYFVQLANFGGAEGTDEWPRLRASQTHTLSLPNTGMAVTIDIGESFDIHPKNKKDVGLRLARNALAKCYGRKIVFSGPMAISAARKNKFVELTFDYAETGLRIRNSKTLIGFELAEEKGVFLPVKARISGRKVIIDTSIIKKPTRVRYAWHKNPECNLVNGEDLPAIPFMMEIS